jgi:hypothetical protein
MSSTISPLPIRLFCDIAAPQTRVDLNRTNAAPQFYRGNDIEIDIGIGQNGALLAPTIASSGAGGIASVTCQVFASENDTNAPMMAGTVTAANMNLTLTQGNWNAGGSANSHAQFIFPNSQTAIPLNGAASQSYWLRIFATTTDTTPKIIPLIEGPITVLDGPMTELSAPPLAGARFYTVNGQVVFQILDPTTGLYHTLIAVNEGGVEELQVSDQGY